MTLLPDLGPHGAFIWAAYAVFFITLTCLAAWIMTDEQRQRRLLAELETRGVRRRSAAKPVSQTVQGAAPPAPKSRARGSTSRNSPAGRSAARTPRPRRPGAPAPPKGKP